MKYATAMSDCAAVKSHWSLKRLGCSLRHTTSQVRLIHANCFVPRIYTEANAEILSLGDTDGWNASSFCN